MFPQIRDPKGFNAKFVHEPKAGERADASFPISPAPLGHEQLTKDLMLLLKECGRLKTGRAVDFGWCWSAAQIAAQQKMGVLDFDLGQEANEKAILAVTEVISGALVELKRKEAASDGGTPF